MTAMRPLLLGLAKPGGPMARWLTGVITFCYIVWAWSLSVSAGAVVYNLLSGYGTVLALGGSLAVEAAVWVPAGYFYDSIVGPLVRFLLFLLAFATDGLPSPGPAISTTTRTPAAAKTMMIEAERNPAAGARRGPR
jgi:hypothetical protein